VPEGHAPSFTKAYHIVCQSHGQSCTSFKYCVKILHSRGSSSNSNQIVPKITVLTSYCGVVFKVILVEIHYNNIGFYRNNSY